MSDVDGYDVFCYIQIRAEQQITKKEAFSSKIAAETVSSISKL